MLDKKELESRVVHAYSGFERVTYIVIHDGDVRKLKDVENLTLADLNSSQLDLISVNTDIPYYI